MENGIVKQRRAAGYKSVLISNNNVVFLVRDRFISLLFS